MSLTNAISGIVMIGGLVSVAVSGIYSWGFVLSLISVFFASVNIFGGFVVTQRMLAMFKRKR